MKIDGVDLDTMAHHVGVGSSPWEVPEVRGENVVVPARHGTLYVPDKTFHEADFTLEIVVQGAEDDGTLPANQLIQLRENIDKILRLITKRKRLLHIETELDDGSTIECYAECVGTFPIERNSSLLPFAKFNAGFKVPRAFWQDSLVTEYSSPQNLTPNQVLKLAPFEGGTAPMDDLVYLIHGPIAEPELYVTATGAYTRLGMTVPNGSAWRIDTATWSSVMGAGATFDSTGHPSVISKTVHGGSGPLIDLPPLSAGENAIEIGGANMGANTQLEVRGRRKHLIG